MRPQKSLKISRVSVTRSSYEKKEKETEQITNDDYTRDIFNARGGDTVFSLKENLEISVRFWHFQLGYVLGKLHQTLLPLDRKIVEVLTRFKSERTLFLLVFLRNYRK